MIASDTGQISGFLKVVAELSLEHSVDALDLLFHRELTSEFARAPTSVLSMDTWGVRTTLHSTFRTITTLSFEEEFFASATTEFTF
jgi:hypothetical protein